MGTRPDGKKEGNTTHQTYTVAAIDGDLVTAAELIPRLMRNGMYLEPASNCAGVRKGAVYQWLRDGAIAFDQRHTRQALKLPVDLTEYQLGCIAFQQAIIQAECEWEREANDILGQLARGGLKTVKVTVKRGPPGKNGDPGEVLESTTVTETLPPAANVVQWRLKRRFPERYADRIEIAKTGESEGKASEQDTAEALIDDLEAFLTGGSPSGSE